MARKNYYVFVARLRSEAVDDTVLSRNPGRASDKPPVCVWYVSDLPRERFRGNDFSSVKKRALQNHASELLPLLGGANPYAKGHKREWGALSTVVEKVEELREEGYTVYNRRLSQTRLLYVLELDPEILEQKSPNSDFAQEGNRDYNLAPVYVGETGKSRKQRLRDHKAGRNSSVGDFVVKLRPDLTHPDRKLTKLDALREEHNLAWRLADKGHPVYGGR